MPSEGLASSRSNFRAIGTLSAQRTVAQMDICGVQQRRTMTKTGSGGFVPPQVSTRNIDQITCELYGTFKLLWLSAITKEVSADTTGF